MQRIDATAIHRLGIPRLLLMEYAGLAVARETRALYQTGVGAARPSRPIVVCCGTGYNGGDGMAAARHLQDWGWPVRVVLTGTVRQLREEPAIYANILRRLRVRCLELSSERGLATVRRWLAGCSCVVDALLGIGVRGTVREPMASLMTAINACGRPVVAVDMPSGLDADTGRPHGASVRATVTVSFGLAKRGCRMGDGPQQVGRLVIDAITIPRALLGTR